MRWCLDSFQFSFERSSNFDEVRSVLSESFGIPQSIIFDSDEYWDHAEARDLAGVWIMHDDDPFKAIANVYSGLNVGDEELGRLAIRIGV